MERLPTSLISHPDRLLFRPSKRRVGRNLGFVVLELLAAACGGNAASSPTPEPAERVIAAVPCATGPDVLSVTYNGETVDCDDLIGFVPTRDDFERVGKSEDICTGTITAGGTRFKDWVPRSSDPSAPNTMIVELRDGTLVTLECGVSEYGTWYERITTQSPQR